jgi:hypothetical protein
MCPLDSVCHGSVIIMEVDHVNIHGLETRKFAEQHVNEFVIFFGEHDSQGVVVEVESRL